MSTTMPAFHPRTERRLAAAGRVHDLLRSAIMHGEIASGVLPGEAELMETFSASRQVIRGALELLRQEGLVRRMQGSGTLVTSLRVTHDFGFLHGPDQHVDHRVLSTSQEVAPPSVARKLDIPDGGLVGIVEVVTDLADTPLDTTTVYLRMEFLPFVAAVGPHDEWFSLYDHAGVEVGITDHAIESSIADPFNASLLGVDPGHPLLVLERLVHDPAGNPLEYAFTRIRGDRLTLLQSLGRSVPPDRPPQS
ncbi:GntR family transcriptional regulator [Herbiconiux sp. 11R-BC]|uniref:GntR family transcriptional regulator n=1 Tax=Herbiconiux sp. 11R-BC TaxID=3111637 RepID=UPI003C11594D